jgi:3-deoxy-manno-octulosonate cytidylyltransferase (CMP-KDO synthetase)
VRRTTRIPRILVATDDERIADCVRGFGGEVAMTSANHPTGTDRIAEAIRDVPADLIVNVQGDEPLIPPAVLDQLVEHMHQQPTARMGTIARPLALDDPDTQNPNVVKVVRDRAGFALYFSRSLIPYGRGVRDAHAQPLHHWGVYAYRRDFLYEFIAWPQGSLEQCEQLEQLRALEHGARIFVLVAPVRSIGVDVPGDVAKVEAQLRLEGLL